MATTKRSIKDYFSVVYVSSIPKIIGYKWAGPGLSAGMLKTPGSDASPTIGMYIKPQKDQAPCNFLDAAARLHDLRYMMAANMTQEIWLKYLTLLNQSPTPADRSVYKSRIFSETHPENVLRHMVQAADAELMTNISRAKRLRAQTYCGSLMASIVGFLFGIKTRIGYLYCIPETLSVFMGSDLSEIPDYMGMSAPAAMIKPAFRPGSSFKPDRIPALMAGRLRRTRCGVAATLLEACDACAYLEDNLAKMFAADAHEKLGPINSKCPQFCTDCFSEHSYPDYGGDEASHNYFYGFTP